MSSPETQPALVTDKAGLEALCDSARRTGIVAFDTEFVSEYTYRPELCLLQFATPETCVALDPFEIGDLDPWWDVMADDQTTVVVHGGQAEIRFCLDLGGRPPRRLVDVQLAEGLRSRSYPLSYTNLVQRVLGRKIHGTETRTDWRRRPLSPSQLRYALDDVLFLLEIWQTQHDSLERHGRLEWADAEFARYVADLQADSTRDTWQKLPGVHRLSRRELGVLRELAACREAEARERNRPVRRILRDDLLVELCRRQPRTTAELLATRDMERGDYRRSAPRLLEAVERGLALPDSELPGTVRGQRNETGDDEHVLGQFLGMALANRCAEQNVAMSLVGTTADLRHLVRWHVYGEQEGPAPRLAQGWRAEVCGDLLSEVLDGKIALRVADPESDHPLIFERAGTGETVATHSGKRTRFSRPGGRARRSPSGRSAKKPPRSADPTDGAPGRPPAAT